MDIPIKKHFKKLFGFSILLLCLLVSVSLIGIINQKSLYTNDKLIETFVPNDYVNLLIGFPFLLTTLILVYKKKMMGFLIWPGSLFYLIYAFFPYLISVPVSYLFLAYLLIFTISLYLLIALICFLNTQIIMDSIGSNTKVKFPAMVLIVLSFIILIRQLLIMYISIKENTLIDTMTIALWIDDFVIASPLMIFSGIFLLKNKAIGFATAPGLLFSFAVLSFSLLPFLYFQSKITTIPLKSIDIIVLIIMTILCLIPFLILVTKKRSTK